MKCNVDIIFRGRIFCFYILVFVRKKINIVLNNLWYFYFLFFVLRLKFKPQQKTKIKTTSQNKKFFFNMKIEFKPLKIISALLMCICLNVWLTKVLWAYENESSVRIMILFNKINWWIHNTAEFLFSASHSCCVLICLFRCAVLLYEF